jgi:DNA modification methylase
VAARGALFPGSVAYVWHAGRYASVVQDSLAATGFEVRAQIIWAKDRFALSVRLKMSRQPNRGATCVGTAP